MRPDHSARPLLVTRSYNQLSKGSKKNFLSSTQFVVDAVLEFLSGSDADQVRQELFLKEGKRSNIVMDPKLMNILTAIAEAYNNTDSSIGRRTILSIVAKQVDYNLISSVIPGLTRYRYTAARLYAEEYGKGMIKVPSHRANIRYDPAQVEHFIDFILSPHISIDLPFGEKTLRLSSGTELYVPDIIRSINSTRIIQQYYEYCHQMCSDFSPLSSSSLYKILDCCKASTRKALQGLNNFVADGVTAFEGLKSMIENLLIDVHEKTRLTTDLQRAKQYLKSDFKLHVSRLSRVPDHCILFALSERHSQFFSSSCDHNHDETCIECTNLKSVIFDIKEAIQKYKSQEIIDRTMYDYDDFVESILAWKAHLLRCVNQDQCRTDVLQVMSANSIFLNLDWAMKWNPLSYREGQAAFFGKKGISWHITVVSTKPGNNDAYVDEEHEMSSDTDDEDTEEQQKETMKKIALDHNIFVHVFDQVTQDTDAVLSILQDILVKVKTCNPTIESAYIRSDNAGCYHSAQTLLSLPYLSKTTGITIKRFDFSDPQGGKGMSDLSHVRRDLNEGHDVSTAAQFVAACASHGGVKNVHAFECQLTPTRSKTKVKINDITKLHNFIYESTAIRSYRAWNIGIGNMIMLDGNSGVSPNINSLVCVNPSLEANRLVNSSVGDRLNDTVSSVLKDADVNDQEKSKPKLFFCDYEGCICRFLNYGNLLHHIANGNHIERVEKLSIKDLAMVTYKSKLDAAENQQLLFLELQRINFNRDDYNHIPTLNQGWALPLNRKVQTLSPKVKQFLKKKFDDGQLHGIRWQPQAVVDEMKYSKDPETGLYLFDLSELVKVSTVRSYFSRQKASNNKVNNPKQSTLEDNSLITGEQYDIEEDIEDEAFQEQLAIDLELQLGDIRSIANKDNMAEINLATATSKRALSSFENENLSHTRKSSRFPRKKEQ
ncbi:unnamed protein product [Rotaria sp. Silwood2]|nr:unnamed protein product [Rotaria sp. Silwood2]